MQDFYSVRHLMEGDLPRLIELADQVYAQGLYNDDNVHQFYQYSMDGSDCFSFVLEHNESRSVDGFSIVFPPGLGWQGDLEKMGVQVGDWPTQPSRVAYFKSLFIEPKIRKLGYGRKLSTETYWALKNSPRIDAYVCYSPDIKKMNRGLEFFNLFEHIKMKNYPGFWANSNFGCSQCAKRPCQCTAIEWIRLLEDEEVF